MSGQNECGPRFSFQYSCNQLSSHFVPWTSRCFVVRNLPNLLSAGHCARVSVPGPLCLSFVRPIVHEWSASGESLVPSTYQQQWVTPKNKRARQTSDLAHPLLTHALVHVARGTKCCSSCMHLLHLKKKV